jgi:hypothetical protein
MKLLLYEGREQYQNAQSADGLRAKRFLHEGTRQHATDDVVTTSSTLNTRQQRLLLLCFSGGRRPSYDPAPPPNFSNVVSNSAFKIGFGAVIPSTTCLAHAMYSAHLSLLQSGGGLRRFEILSASPISCARTDFFGALTTCAL